MMAKMWLILTILPFIFADGTFINPPDFFYRHMANHLDHNVNPCDNFYRHVCPRGILNNDTVNGKTGNYLEAFTSEENEAIVPAPSVQTVYNLLPAIFKKIDQLAEKEGCSCNSPSSKMCEHHCYMGNAIQEILMTVSGFKNQYTLYNTLHATNQFHIMEVIERNIEKLFQNMVSEMKQELNSTTVVNSYHEKVLAFLKSDSSSFHKILGTMKDIGQSYKIFYPKFIDVIKTITSQVNEKGQVSEESLKEFMQLIEFWSKLGGSHTFQMNAENLVDLSGPDIIRMSFGSIHMFQQIRNPALKAGFVNVLLGHEIGHTYTVAEINARLSAVYHSRAECIGMKYKDACRMFDEEGLRCESDFPTTHEEDASDFVGTRIAYLSFLREFAERLDDVTMQVENNDRTFTNRQLFFYGSAIAFCKENPGHSVDEKGDPDVHSGPLFRVNAYMREMAAFSEAFNCQPNDAMYQSKEKQCMLYGNEPLFI